MFKVKLVLLQQGELDQLEPLVDQWIAMLKREARDRLFEYDNLDAMLDDMHLARLASIEKTHCVLALLRRDFQMYKEQNLTSCTKAGRPQTIRLGRQVG